MSKCALPAKREGHQNGTILQTQEGSSVSRNGRKILPAFLLTVFIAALATAAMPQKKEKAPNILRHRSKRNLTKKPSGRCGVRTVKGEASSRPCMPQSECGAGHTGYRASIDPPPGGSKDTGGAFRSRVQRPGVRHRSIGAGQVGQHHQDGPIRYPLFPR